MQIGRYIKNIMLITILLLLSTSLFANFSLPHLRYKTGNNFDLTIVENTITLTEETIVIKAEQTTGFFLQEINLLRKLGAIDFVETTLNGTQVQIWKAVFK